MVFFGDYNISVVNTCDDADINANAIEPRETVVATDEHAQIRDENILEASDLE